MTIVGWQGRSFEDSPPIPLEASDQDWYGRQFGWILVRWDVVYDEWYHRQEETTDQGVDLL